MRFGYQRPDLQKAGGLLDARKIVGMANTHTTLGCKDMRGSRPATGHRRVPRDRAPRAVDQRRLLHLEELQP